MKILFGSFIVILALVLSAGDMKKPRILIIGDSISLGYTPYVKEYFKEMAIVVHNPGNAGHTGMGLENVRKWVGDEDWDMIQFNWGLWDLCYRHPDSKLYGNRDKVNGKITYTIDEYRANLDSIVILLKSLTDAELIFVCTTYVPEEEGGRYKNDAQRYNRVAKEVMKKHGVQVNDIYKESRAIHKKYGVGSEDVHYTDQGNEQLSRFIIDYLKSYKKPRDKLSQLLHPQSLKV